MNPNKRKSQVKDIIELYKEIEMLKTELKATELKKGANDEMVGKMPQRLTRN